MVKVSYVASSGAEFVVEADVGASVMSAAVKNSVPGIDGDCGGACVCATCHVYVDDSWRAITGERTPREEAMLDFADNVEPASRLSCQITVTEKLDGLIVRVPSK